MLQLLVNVCCVQTLHLSNVSGERDELVSVRYMRMYCVFIPKDKLLCLGISRSRGIHTVHAMKCRLLF